MRKRPMQGDAGEIFTLEDVAAYLKVAKRTVYRLAAGRRIPAFKVGGAWRFSRADIDRWIKQQSMEGVDLAGDDDASGERSSNEEGA